MTSMFDMYQAETLGAEAAIMNAYIHIVIARNDGRVMAACDTRDDADKVTTALNSFEITPRAVAVAADAYDYFYVRAVKPNKCGDRDPHFVIDSRTADGDVGYPGDLIGERPSKAEAYKLRAQCFLEFLKKPWEQGEVAPCADRFDPAEVSHE